MANEKYIVRFFENTEWGVRGYYVPVLEGFDGELIDTPQIRWCYLEGRAQILADRLNSQMNTNPENDDHVHIYHLVAYHHKFDKTRQYVLFTTYTYTCGGCGHTRETQDYFGDEFYARP